MEKGGVPKLIYISVRTGIMMKCSNPKSKSDDFDSHEQ